MPDPVERTLLSDPSNQVWLQDMQAYFTPNKDSGRPRRKAMPDMWSSSYNMENVGEDNVRRVLIALFGGDEIAAKKYLRGEDPIEMIKYGGDRLPPLPQMAGGRPPTDPLLEEAKRDSGRSGRRY